MMMRKVIFKERGDYGLMFLKNLRMCAIKFYCGFGGAFGNVTGWQ